jgi:hypothetical protein
MKWIVWFCIALAVMIWVPASFADTVQKFQGGFKDVIMAPLQISNNVKTETANAKFLPFALTGGFLKGSFYMAKQIITGTLNMVTSPLDSIHKR